MTAHAVGMEKTLEKQLAVRVPAWLFDETVKRAGERDRTVAWCVRQALAAWLAEEGS